jgi:hypothetical protein
VTAAVYIAVVLAGVGLLLVAALATPQHTGSHVRPHGEPRERHTAPRHHHAKPAVRTA